MKIVNLVSGVEARLYATFGRHFFGWYVSVTWINRDICMLEVDMEYSNEV